MNKVCWHRTAI